MRADRIFALHGCEEVAVKLQEYRSKEILAGHGVPLVPGETATTPQEARAAAERIGGRVVVKAQVLAGGRGKAGGVKIASTVDEAERLAGEILGMEIKGVTVKTVLVAPAIEIATELYLGLVLDRSAKAITVFASAEGGVEIEEVARTSPEAILRLPLHPLLGLQDHEVRRVGFFLALRPELRKDFARVLWGLYRAFVESDADLAEINPLVISADGRLLALDAKIVVDDSALYRHTEIGHQIPEALYAAVAEVLPPAIPYPRVVARGSGAGNDWLVLERANREDGSLQSAQDALEEGLRLHPGHPGLTVRLIELLALRTNWKECVEQWHRLGDDASEQLRGLTYARVARSHCPRPLPWRSSSD
jgi:hypothetical protein